MSRQWLRILCIGILCALTLFAEDTPAACTTTPISSGQTLSGTLTSACASARRSGAYAQFYTFSASTGDNIQVAVNSLTFDTFAYLAGSSGTLVAYDDDSGNGTNSLINYTAAGSGTYTIEVTSYYSGATGSFTVSLLVSSGASISIVGLSPSGISLTQGGSGQSISVTLSRRNYTGSVTLSLSSLPTNVFSGFSQPGTGNSGVITLLAASNAAVVNNQTITITASGSGVSSVTATFTLTVIAACPPTAISSGQTLNGTLTSSCPSIRRSGAYAQFYTFSASAGDTIQVAVNSSVFDAYTYLVGPSGSVVTYDDDSGSGTNSLIDYTATSSGTYTIEATSYYSGVTGAFTVSLTVSSVTPSIRFASLTPPSISLTRGGSGQTVSVTLSRTNYTGNITLSLSALPANALAGINQPGTGDLGSIALLAASNAALVNNQTVTVTASGSGVASVTATFTLTVTGIVPPCSATPISSGQTLSGTLSSACGSSQRTGAYAQLYTFTASAGDGIQVAVNSSAFDTYAYLVGPSGSVVAYDDDSGSGTNSLIDYAATSSGTYTIEATSYYAGTTGTFTVSLTAVTTPLPCTATSISTGQTMSGTLTSACASTRRSGSFVRLYTFNATTGGRIQVAVNSTAFDAYVYLVGPSGTVVASDDDSGGSRNALINYSAASSGTYTIEATSYYSGSTGAFTVSLTVTSAVSCTATPISTGQTLTGTLSSACTSTRRTGSYAQLYTFSASSGDQVRVAVNSTAFDAYAFLVGPSGTVVASDDDSGGSRNSLINYTASASGTYTIEATSYYSGSTGAFTVSLTVMLGGGGGLCTATPITTGQTLSGTLAPGCPSSRRSGSYAQLYTFSATAGQSIQVAVNSTAFDAYAYLVGPSGMVVASDDDSGGSRNARINYPASASGTYTIEATSYYSSTTGPFSVTLTLGSVPVGNQQPNLLLPLPGARNWLLTVQTGSSTSQCSSGMGGLAFDGSYDCFHSGTAKYSLDFDDLTREDGPLTGIQDVDVLAAGDGMVRQVVINPGQNQSCRCLGNYVVIDHTNGFTTSYGHLKDGSITVGNGATVRQGDKIGVMGTSGQSTGIHLHFQVEYNNQGAAEATVLDTTVVDGRRIIDYRVGSLNSPAYYPSSNRASLATSCAPIPITTGQTLSRFLSPACPSTRRSGSYAQLYTFSATAGQSIQVAVNSTAFDAYAYLVGPSGTVVASDDDSGGSRNALINYTATAAGTYTIEVTSYYTGSTGAFTVSLSGAPSCPSTAITSGQTLNGTLTSACVSTRRSGSYARLYTFSASSSDQVQLAVNSSAFDAYVYLVDPSGSVVAYDDDSGGNRNSRINYTVPASASGTYTIEVTSSVARASGTFTLSLNVVVPNQDITLTIDANPYSNNLTSGSATHWYKFDVVFSAKYVIETHTVGINLLTDTEIFLYGPSDRNTLITSDNDTGYLYMSKIERNLTAGTYFVKVMGSSNSTGPYTVDVIPYGQVWDFKVAFEWQSPTLSTFEPEFRRASNWVYDATEEQFRIKKLDVYLTNGGLDYDWLTAQIQVFNSSLRSHVTNPPLRQVRLGGLDSWYRSDKVIAHELGHFKLDLYDEYVFSNRCSTDNNLWCFDPRCIAGGGTCQDLTNRQCPSSTTTARTYEVCLMTQLIQAFPGEFLGEFCTPDIHALDNNQEDVNHESCWSTIKRKFSWVQMPQTVLDIQVGTMRNMNESAGVAGLVKWTVH